MNAGTEGHPYQGGSASTANVSPKPNYRRNHVGRQPLRQPRARPGGVHCPDDRLGDIADQALAAGAVRADDHHRQLR